MRTEHQVSAGGLVVRGDEVLLISTKEGERWQLPKGHIEAGESRRQAAEREVREETGIIARISAPLPDIEYWFYERGAQRIHKRVYYYLMTFEGGDVSNYDPEEVFGAHWMSWDEALDRLSFPNERKVVKAARRLMKESLPEVVAAAHD